MAKFPTVYPFVAAVHEPEAYAAGPFNGARPLGVTVHYTADRDLARVRRTLQEQGLGYHLIIDRVGKVTQLAWLNQRVNHAGKAMWRELSPNRWHAAVAVLSWGHLDKNGTAHNGEPVRRNETVKRPGLDGRVILWDAATMAQESTLVQVLRWFVAAGVPVENICGHDECAIPAGRKPDPGGVLKWSMAELRAHVASGAAP